MNSGHETESARLDAPFARSSKKAEIVHAATRRFGRDGYAATKWADIALDVGLRPNSLYHYFESKRHCLFVIMDEAIEDFHARFRRSAVDHAKPLDALQAIINNWFRLSDHEIQRNRVLAAEQGLLALERESEREEQARQAVRERLRELESEWATLLARAMDQGAIPNADPPLLTRAILGLYTSIWNWYCPAGEIALRRTAEFYVGRILEILCVGSGKIEPAVRQARN
jgi:TetR/AcrR family transcriptional regulator, cholesterol catabolism regulator